MVSIQVGQPKKEEAATHVAVFFMLVFSLLKEGRAQRGQSFSYI
jgi:hypothetical protein